ncbi:hypothetical protein N9X96_00235 [bacterium]|nr:hypothetical protein [bacterium]
MADRFPLIVDADNTNIKELPSGDNLDLTGSDIVNVVDVTTSGNMVVGGNLTVNGTTTTINSATLEIDDKNIVLASGAADAAAANGAGISIDGASANLTYSSSTDGFSFNKGVTVPSLTTTGNLSFGDNDKAIFGAGSDLQIFSEGSSGNSFINETGNGSLFINASNLYLRKGEATFENFVACTANGDVKLYYDNAEKLATTSYGVDITGRLVTTSHIDAPDNAKIRLGDGDDLQIYHSGSHSFISEAGTGDLYIGASSNIALMNAAFSENKLLATTDGALKLYYDGSQKLATTSTGIDVTGTVVSDGLTSAGDATITGSSSGSTVLTLTSNALADTPLMVFQRSGGAVAGKLAYEDSNTAMSFGTTTAHELKFLTSNTERMQITSAGLVGIGTDSPETNLHIEDSSSFSIIRLVSSTTENAGIDFGDPDDRDIGRVRYNNSDNSMVFHTNAAEQMRIDSSGNVGIGESSPTAGVKLHVTNALQVNQYLESTGNATNSILQTGADGNSAYMFNRANAALTFGTNNTERMRIRSDGTIQFGSGSVNSAYVLGSAPNTYNSGWDVNDDSFATWLNYSGYQGGTTRYRDLIVGDGKNGRIATFDGSSGNLLVGKTATDLDVAGSALFNTGQAYHTRSGDTALYLNRLSSDGTIADFRKDGTTVGSIFNSGTTMGVGSLDTGVLLANNIDAILPWNASTNAERGGAIDLGRATTGQFKDLYLSGTANVGGVTVAGNLSVDGGTIKLDGNYPTGTENVALGDTALDSVESGGVWNVAIGSKALTALTTGDANTAVGRVAMESATTGGSNTALGYAALNASTTASNNTAVGYLSLFANTTGSNNVAVGEDALQANTTASNNTAVGQQSMYYNTGTYNAALGQTSLHSNTTGNYNVAIGGSSLFSNTTASNNTAVGYQSLYANTTGIQNTAVGVQALMDSTTGNFNTAVGYLANENNTTGSSNVAVGRSALNENTTGESNIAIGRSALLANTTASNNTAVGASALLANTTGTEGVAVGTSALAANTTGNSNTAVGINALVTNTTGLQNVANGGYSLRYNTTGGANTAHGFQALQSNTTASNNTAVGYQSLTGNTTSSQNTAVGYQALASQTTGTNVNTAIGYRALAGGNNSNNYNNTAVGGYALENNIGTNNTAVGRNALLANTSGTRNIAIGTSALDANTTASYNVAIGVSALTSNTTGEANVAIGDQALSENTTADNNTAVGYASMYDNSTGQYNLASGFFSLQNNTTGNYNTALGSNALDANTTASNNTAVGYRSLYANTTASNNTAVGYQALTSNTTGTPNTAVGQNALYANTEGAGNTGVGQAALEDNTTGNYNAAFGRDALGNNTTGISNTALGYGSGFSNTTGSNVVFVGEGAGYYSTGASNTFIGKDSGVSVTTGANNTILGRYNGNQNGLDIRTASNHVVLSDGNGNVRSFWDNAGNMYMHTSGSGIYIGGASSANLLDDYEEGTWTPALSSGTVTTGTSRYTKVGRLVTCHTSFTNFSDTTSTTTVGISGLPFAAESSDRATTLGCIAQHIANLGAITGAYLDTTTRILLYNTSSGGFSNLQHEDLNGSSSIYISFSYFAA